MKFWAHFLIKNYKEVENIWDGSTQDPPHTTLGGTPRSKKPQEGQTALREGVSPR